MKLLQYQVMTMWPGKCKKFRFRFKHCFEHCVILCNFGLFKLSLVFSSSLFLAPICFHSQQMFPVGFAGPYVQESKK